MKNRVRCVVLCVAVAMECTSAFAGGWSQDMVEWGNALGSAPKNFKSSEAITAWAAAHSSYYQYKWSSLPKLKMEQLSLRDFSTGQLSIATQLHKDSDDQVLPRDLVIYLPGLFGDSNTLSTYRAAYHFGSRGYHFIALANPWSLSYVAGQPKNVTGELIEPGNVASEAQIVLNAIAKIREVYFSGSAHPVKIHLVGESYGAILGLVVGAFDSQKDVRQVDGQITLYSPPLEVAAGLQSLDLGYELSRPTYLKTCQKQENYLAWRLLIGGPKSDWGQALTQCTSSIVYQAFQQSLVKMAEQFVQVNHLSLGDLEVPNTLQFMEFVEKFTPQRFLELKARKTTSLLYWIKRYAPDRLHLLRLMAAQDDFLNHPELLPDLAGRRISWEWVTELFQGVSGAHVLVLPWGGHVGFVGLDEFQSLLDQEGM